MFRRSISSVFGRICFIVLTMEQKRSYGIHKTGCKRFPGVKGFTGQQNDVITCGSVQQAKQHIVFFGGDVQDYKENMIRFNNEKYHQWDLESTACLIQAQFPDSAVFVIKPCQMFLNTFSMYLNFLAFDVEGKPEFSNDNQAFFHLKKLYDRAKDLAGNPDSCQKNTNSNVAVSCTNNIPVVIIGFSKGCVVLNQLVFGLKDALKNEELKPFLDQVVALYWLDGGHIGGSNAYITDHEKLKTLVTWNKEIFVNVTPYQVRDPMRKWIGREEKKFVEKLTELKAKITEKKLFMDVPGSIDNHFEILKNIN